jgi:ankyrin repeat protein
MSVVAPKPYTSKASPSEEGTLQHRDGSRRYAWLVAPMALAGLAMAAGIGVVAWFGEGWLVAAVERGDVRTMKFLLALNPQWALAKRDVAYAPSLILARGALDKSEICKTLILYGADPNAICDGIVGMPLYYAIDRNDSDLVKFLLKNGAEAHPDKRHYIINAAGSNNHKIVEVMIEAGARVKNLYLESSDISIKSPYIKDIEYCTPLDYAAKYNNIHMVEILLEAGAEADLPTRHNEHQTPRALATDPAVIALLKQAEEKALAARTNAGEAP